MKHRSITVRLVAWLVTASTAVLVALGAYDYLNEARSLERDLNARCEQAAVRLETNLVDPVYNLNQTQIAQVLRAEMNDPAVSRIVVKERADNTERVVTALYRQADGSLAEKPSEAENLLLRTRKLTRENQEIGFVELGVSRSDSLARLRALAWSITARTVITNLVICAAVFVIMRGLLLRPLSLITDTLREASVHVSAASGQVSGASQSLAEGASEQAASLEETSASLEEINSQTKRNAESAEVARSLAEAARQATDAGTRDMEEMIAAMNDIKASSDNIAKIIKTIDEIAFQTNILALNAAVEAARAGEVGAGFAVVAEEVRNLAQRAAQAARETAQRIDDSIAKSSRGMEISGKMAEGLKEIAEKTHRMSDLVVEIATASKEQALGVGQVGTAVTQMDKITQANAANAEETASAAEELSAQATALGLSVDQLLHLLNGGEATPPIAPSHPQAKKPHSANEHVSSNGHLVRPPCVARSTETRRLPSDGVASDPETHSPSLRAE